MNHCDRKVCLVMESNMPGAGPAKYLSTTASQSIRDNWYNNNEK